MLELEPAVREELDALAPREPEEAPDWDDVRRRARLSERRRRRGAGRVAVVAAAASAVVAVPSIALSSEVRRFLRLEDPRPTEPVLLEARLLVEAPAGDGIVARMYEAPASGGGACEFVTVAPAGSSERPERSGGGGCTLDAGTARRIHSPELPIQWTVNVNRKTRWNDATWTPPVLSGWVAPRLGATRVVLEWNGGAEEAAFANDHFVYADASLYNPPEQNLPYEIAAYDAGGREVARERIPRDLMSID